MLLTTSLALQACASEASSQPIIMVDDIDSAHIDSCARSDRQLGRRFLECVLGEAKSWRIGVSVSGGLPGAPGTEIFVPDAIGVLQDIVDRCNLGRTFLQSGTDGQASLLIGNPDLSSTQIECVRSAERPGLFLAKTEY